MMGRLLSGNSVLILAFLFLVSGCQKSVEEWTELGEAAIKRQALDEAEVAFQKALGLDPLHPQALYGMGWIFSSRRDLAGARIFYERAIQVAPNFYGGYKGMGSIHMAMGFLPQAEASFKKALQLKPDEAATYGSLGYVYMMTRRLDKAEEVFRKALALEPDRGELHYLMAELRSRQGADDAALEEIAKGDGKTFEEVKFRQLNEELRGRLYLKKALEGVTTQGHTFSAAEVKVRLDLLAKAEVALDKALEMAYLDERVRLFRLKKKVVRARIKLTGPAPI